MSSETNKKINIIDCTLREGNQSPKVSFNLDASICIANKINAYANIIEIGHPFASKSEMLRVKSVVNSSLNAQILAHARACEDDISAAFDSGAQWVGIFIGINDISQKFRLNKSKSEIFSIIKHSINFAKNIGLKVRFTVEDSSRTNIEDLIDAYRIAINAGANRICFSDTVGIMEPSETKNKLTYISDIFSNMDIEVHFHDDRGLAMANSLAAIEAGANWVSTSVNGLGERAGITDTCLFIANLVYKKLREESCLNGLLSLSKYVMQRTESFVDARRPITGENAFLHKAKLHVDAVNRNQCTYNWMNPVLLQDTTYKNIGAHPVLGEPYLV